MKKNELPNLEIIEILITIKVYLNHTQYKFVQN